MIKYLKQIGIEEPQVLSIFIIQYEYISLQIAGADLVLTISRYTPAFLNVQC